MSIILKALKKVQDQKAEGPPEAFVSGAEKIDEFDPTPALSPSSAVMSADEAPTGSPVQRELRSPPATVAVKRRRSVSGFRILIGLILVLGLFTTGWFVNTIFLSSRQPVQTGEPAPQTAAEQHVGQVSAPPQISPPASREMAASLPKQAPAPVAEQVEIRTESTRDIAKAAQPAARVARTEEPNLPPKPAAKEAHSVSPIVEEQTRRPEQRRRKENAEGPEKSEEPAGRPELKINAIAWRETEPKAIVNMQRVFVGDVVEGATVKTINRHSVVFEYEGETFEVRF